MSPPSKRSALETLTKARLVELAREFELGMPATTSKPELVETLARSHRACFEHILGALKATNQVSVHGVPKTTRVVGPRLSLTFHRMAQAASRHLFGGAA